MNEYEAENEALAEAGETYLLEQTLHFIKSGKNVPPKDVAAALRCELVPIPKEILDYAAGMLDGSPKRRGRPINVMLESAREAFSDRDFQMEDIESRYEELRKKGMKKYDILEVIAEEYGKSSDWVSAILYPRRKD
ncbi:MAG: hypothetical protein ACP59X_04390 [Solidesulfovibrio sp. DCME]|uniref:hypothetical protein n=1 Tax=Solidesulfovibrio sp. DCME TaxID=3447380 RepID=UPI003D0E5504